jgi:hypothetical protein
MSISMTTFHRPHGSTRRFGRRRFAALGCLALVLTGCSRQEPTTARRAPAAPGLIAPVDERSAAPSDAGPSTRPEPTAPARTAAADAPDAAAALPDAGLPADVSQATLLADDGGALPQTQDRPAQNERFHARMALLFQAIREDDPARARSVFFPLVAYRQVKAIAAPDRDYERRLLRAFERDIHGYHRKLGAGASQVRLASVEVPEAQARWMKPGSEGNKLGYWRVLRSALRVADPSGTERKLGVTSLISWRGEWYVVHLNGFE